MSTSTQQNQGQNQGQDQGPDQGPDRRLARREAKQASILAEAWFLARRDGLAGISLRDLADRVGLRQPSLYVYFASKHDLYDVMFADGYQQFLAYLQRRPADNDPGTALVDLVTDLVQFSSDDIVRHQLLMQRTIPGFEPSQPSWDLAQQFYDLVRDRLAAAGATRSDDIDVFSALIAGLAHQQIANDPGGTRWVQQAPRVVAMFLTDVARHRPSG
jgi:AcrR family transcriptional regulator